MFGYRKILITFTKKIMETLDQTNTLFSQKSIDSMKTAGTWMKFISILFLIFSLFMLWNTFRTLFLIPIAGFISLAVTGVFIYTNIQLLGMGISVNNMDVNSKSIDSFFAKCKNYFMTWGIVLIIYLVLLIIAFLTGLSDTAFILKQFM